MCLLRLDSATYSQPSRQRTILPAGGRTARHPHTPRPEKIAEPSSPLSKRLTSAAKGIMSAGRRTAAKPCRHRHVCHHRWWLRLATIPRKSKPITCLRHDLRRGKKLHRFNSIGGSPPTLTPSGNSPCACTLRRPVRPSKTGPPPPHPAPRLPVCLLAPRPHLHLPVLAGQSPE